MSTFSRAVKKFIWSDELKEHQELSPLVSVAVFDSGKSTSPILSKLYLSQLYSEQVLVIKDGDRAEFCANSTLDSYLREGYTLVVNEANQISEELADALACFQERFLFPCGVNIYATPAKSRGFLAHYDPHDVIIFQMTGSKKWKIFTPNLNLPLKWEVFPTNITGSIPWAEIVLNPGDCLYLPRGWIHEAVSLDATSVHATYAIHGITYADLILNALVGMIDGNHKLRRLISKNCLGLNPQLSSIETFAELGLDFSRVKLEILKAFESIKTDTEKRMQVVASFRRK